MYFYTKQVVQICLNLFCHAVLRKMQVLATIYRLLTAIDTDWLIILRQQCMNVLELFLY